MTEGLVEPTPAIGEGAQDDTAVENTGERQSEDSTATPAKKRSVTLWQVLIVAILAAFVWFLVIGLNRQNESGQRAAGEAPPFEFTTFEGETISLDSLAGKGVVLNFWASWCDPCRDEADLLEQTWRREKDNGIVFIGLDYLDQEHAALDYLAEFDVTYPNGPDLQSDVARRYGIKGVPETFFIDPEGMIAGHIIGPVISPADLERRLDEIRP